MKKLFAQITINNETYKLKLSVGEVLRLEKQLGGNLLDALLKANQGSLPSLNWMLAVFHGALQKFHHGADVNQAIKLYEDYIDDGGNQTEFLKVITEVFECSGFFPEREKKELESLPN